MKKIIPLVIICLLGLFLCSPAEATSYRPYRIKKITVESTHMTFELSYDIRLTESIKLTDQAGRKIEVPKGLLKGISEIQTSTIGFQQSSNGGVSIRFHYGKRSEKLKIYPSVIIVVKGGEITDFYVGKITKKGRIQDVWLLRSQPKKEDENKP